MRFCACVCSAHSHFLSTYNTHIFEKTEQRIASMSLSLTYVLNSLLFFARWIWCFIHLPDPGPPAITSPAPTSCWPDLCPSHKTMTVRGSQLVHKLALVHGEQGETEERGSHSRLVGGRFNKPRRELPYGACLGRYKTSSSPHAPARILKLIEAFMGLSHVFSPGGLTPQCSLGAASLTTAPTVRMVGRANLQGQER